MIPLNLNNRLLADASYKGNSEEVARLIPLAEPMNNSCQALVYAAGQGHLECVKLLAPVSDTFLGLKEAVWYGQMECIRFLIPLCDVQAENGVVLRFAVRTGNKQTVEEVLPYSDPKINNSRALVMAVLQHNSEIVELLYPLSDPVVALAFMTKDYPERIEEHNVLEQRICEEQRKVLQKQIPTTNCVTRKKM